jgi:hypothetical protein
MSILSYLADTHMSDKNKAGHNYIPEYDFWLKDRQIDSMVEVGFGNGASPKMWREYYPKADIYVMELFGKEFENTWHSPRTDNIGVNIIAGDATLAETWSNIPDNLDMIIDDGSHIPSQQISTLFIGLNKLKSKGLYIIEDVYCNFDPDYSKTDVLFEWLHKVIVNQQSSNLPLLSRDFYTNRQFMAHPACDIFAYHIYKGFIVLEKA